LVADATIAADVAGVEAGAAFAADRSVAATAGTAHRCATRRVRDETAAGTGTGTESGAAGEAARAGSRVSAQRACRAVAAQIDRAGDGDGLRGEEGDRVRRGEAEGDVRGDLERLEGPDRELVALAVVGERKPMSYG
jgi:hypothetical protein